MRNSKHLRGSRENDVDIDIYIYIDTFLMDYDRFMVKRGWAASEWYPQCAIQTPSDCMTSGGRCMPTVLSRQLLKFLGAKIHHRTLWVCVMLACMKFLEWTIHGFLSHQNASIHHHPSLPPFQQRITTLISEHNVFLTVKLPLRLLQQWQQRHIWAQQL